MASFALTSCALAPQQEEQAPDILRDYTVDDPVTGCRYIPAPDNKPSMCKNYDAPKISK